MNRLLLLIFFLLIGISFNAVAQDRKKERLAVLEFKVFANDNDYQEFRWLQSGFAETLSDAFSRMPDFVVLERAQVDKIFNEQHFQLQKEIDSTSIARIGKMLGVESVLIGSCQIHTGHMMVNLRIVNVETGQI